MTECCVPTLRKREFTRFDTRFYVGSRVEVPTGTNMYGVCLSNGLSPLIIESNLTYTNFGLYLKGPTTFQYAIVQFLITSATPTPTVLVDPLTLNFYIQPDVTGSTIYQFPSLSSPPNFQYTVPPGTYPSVYSYLPNDYSTQLYITRFPILTVPIINGYFPDTANFTLTLHSDVSSDFQFELTPFFYLVNVTLGFLF